MSASEESKESNEPKAMATDEGEEVRISEKSVANQLNFFFAYSSFICISGKVYDHDICSCQNPKG